MNKEGNLIPCSFPNGASFRAVVICSTVCKFEDFSVTQILREINFGDFKSSKTAIFAILGALNFVDLVNFGLQKVIKSQNIVAKCAQMANS